MASTARIPLGAPGLYQFPEVPLRALTRVRLDVGAFVGVAPRGPARVPTDGSAGMLSRRTVAIAVESFDEYRQVYGGFEGPGLLPYAVASFFEQGGLRAYIARVVHDYTFDPDPAANDRGVAVGDVPGAGSTAGPLRLRARNEGTWGNQLRAQISFATRTLLFDPGHVSLTGLELSTGVEVTAGALLRLNFGGGRRELRFVAYAIDSPLPQQAGSVRSITFDRASTMLPQTIDIVEAALFIDDGAGRTERYDRLGLSPQHPRWLGATLTRDSAIVSPDPSWLDSPVTPDTIALAFDPPFSELFTGGEDRYRDITPEDFFDPRWTIGDEEPGSGIQALSQIADVSLLVAPDLYSPFPLAEPRKLELPVSLAGPTFARCVDLPTAPVTPEPPLEDLVNMRLDPAIPDDLERITTLQTRLVEFADQMRSFVVLLDVPPGLTERRMLNWRVRFQSSYAAAYHPWLFVVRRDDLRNTRVALPPSAAAAGLIARVENAFGVPHGPANIVAAQVLDVLEGVSPAQHAELHPLGINVYLLERDGVRLTAARTLSVDPDVRQLSVRRVLVLIRRTLEEQMQWVVFEPNNSSLRAELRQVVSVYLRQLFAAGAFKGATEDESFFVRCDDGNNPTRATDLGRLLMEIGVAPAEPLEFILLRLSRDADGSLTVSEARG
jgi:hypothetical protein